MSTQQCQFFLTKKGCRNGDSCRFSHSNNTPASASTPTLAGSTSTTATTDPPSSSSSTNTPASAPRRKVVVAARQPVRKPVPASLQNLDNDTAAASLRSFEINQLSARFASSFTPRSSSSSSIIPHHSAADEEENDMFELKIVPSDPDFPYEINSLHVLLVVPKSYPTKPCSVLVLNRDIPKGFATNLERGFDQAATQQQKSLLAHLNWLDVNMEHLLQKPPAPTIRFIGHANINSSNSTTGKSASVKETSSPVLPPPLPPSSTTSTKKIDIPSKSVPAPAPASQTPQHQLPRQQPTPAPVQKTYTQAERDQAGQQRQKQMNQIQARFRSSYESLSPTSFIISLESTDKEKMPVIWQGPLWVVFLVPALYPLEGCDIRLREDGQNPEIEIWRARNVEQGFRKIVATMPQLSLFQLLNQLNRDLKELMNLPQPSTSSPAQTPARSTPSPSPQSSPVPTFQPAPSSMLKDTTHSGQGSSRAKTPNETNRNDHKGKVIYVDAPQEPRKGNFDSVQDHGAITSDDEEENDDSESDEEESSEEDYTRPTTNNDEEVSEQDTEDEEEESGTKTGGPQIEAAPKRGIEIRMPDLKLDHISVLYCRSLSLLVRCNRCKSLIDMPELVPDNSTASSSSSATGIGAGTGVGAGDKRKWRTCENCQSLLGAHFRTEYIHMQSRTIGYLDLAGCTAYDILPSTFVPTCGECDHIHGSGPDEHQGTIDNHNTSESGSTTTVDATSTQVPQRSSGPTGFRQKVGRGMSATANCRKCHVRLTLTLEGEIKFVKLSPGDLMKASSSDLDLLPLKKRLLNKNKNGLEFELKVGEPLPRKGACDHYKKSRRWFRFPCCSKIYPCHLCHDEKELESHESEYAKRMICGHCSREQVVSDKPCVCGKTPMRTAGGSGAFWEGGEGMRDRVKMSHKDSRKHKGLNKTVAKKQVGAENIRKRAPRP
ncbi:hypothetical protein BGZ96_003950 [Linnemannia gamsii]|uniref:CHY-type domain-containing protein n=1 Tax=Linnemannia gamsii TaxID=64522 RepID=A0ABQ7K8U8_9FUNG|nr:hypothetical protein BGZ96_003950 [Linnemannia gamsii]